MQSPNPDMMRCIEACRECARICLEMASTMCLEMGGKHTEPNHFRTMLDCAEICQTCADFMLRGSQLHSHVCAACAEICTACADSCEQIGDMQECVDICRRCADECRQMAGMGRMAQNQTGPMVPMGQQTRQQPAMRQVSA